MRSGASIIAESIERAVDYKLAHSMRPRTKTVTGVYVGKDGEGKAWVRLSGAEAAIPVRRMAVQADVGDTVSVTVGNGRAVVDSNVSNPSASSTTVTKVERRAAVAQETAVKAVDYAVEAQAASAAARASANGAQVSAEKALVAADSAEADAARAHVAADDAMAEAVIAHDAADSAQADAATAKESATAATNGLSEVEKVVGTLNWIADHGRYVNQAGQIFDASKIYYTRSGTSPNYTYTMVESPVAADIASYYVLVVDESVQNYIASHVYLLNDGLYVTTDSTNGYKVRIDGDSVDVLNTSGTVVATFGPTARIGTSSGVHTNIDSFGMKVFTDSTTSVAEIGSTIRLGDDDTNVLYEADDDLIDGSGMQMKVRANDTVVGRDFFGFTEFDDGETVTMQPRRCFFVNGEDNSPGLSLQAAEKVSGSERFGAHLYLQCDGLSTRSEFYAQDILNDRYSEVSAYPGFVQMRVHDSDDVIAYLTDDGFHVDNEVSAIDSNSVLHNLTEKLDVAGGTATGSINIHGHSIVTASNLDRDGNAPASTTYSDNTFRLHDKDSEALSVLDAARTAGKSTMTRIVTFNEYNATTGHYCYLTMSKPYTDANNDGTLTWYGDNFIIRSSFIDRDAAAPSSDQYSPYIYFQDKDGENLGYIQTYRDTNGNSGIRMYGCNEVGGSTVSNGITLSVRPDGTRGVYVSDSAAWRSAIGVGGLGSRVTKDQSTAVSMANSAYTNICSVSLSAGTWVIEANAQYANNATGRRIALLSTTSAGSSATDLRQTSVTVNANSTGGTYIHTGCTSVFTATTTLYLVGWQSSGSSLSVYGCITAVRII